MFRSITFCLIAVLNTACGQHDVIAPHPVTALTRPVLRLTHRIDEHEKISIPREAVMSRAGISGVFVLDEKNEARFRMIKIGRAHGATIDILSGLIGTETIVLNQLDAIHDGTPITVK